MDRLLIINADDFGLCEGVNRAIAEAHQNGVLTSTTLMTNMPSAEEAIKIAKQLPTLGVGIHLNLTQGQPLSNNPIVTLLVNDNGEFHFSAGTLAYKSFIFSKFRAAIKAELAAQIQWAIDRGVQPTHLDSHKHIHSFPSIYKIVCRLAKQFNINAIRFPYEPTRVFYPPWPPADKDGRKRTRLTRIMARINRLQNPKFLKTKATYGIAHTGKIDINFFKALSSDLSKTRHSCGGSKIRSPFGGPMVAEVMTHPGFTEGLEKFKTRLVEQRRLEFDTLCSKEVRQFLKDASIKLIHYGQLQN
jgi:chitin disaccharide deacetylase